MKQENARKWLDVDAAWRKLKRARHWMTTLDPETKHVDEALKNLEKARKVLEEG